MALDFCGFVAGSAGAGSTIDGEAEFPEAAHFFAVQAGENVAALAHPGIDVLQVAIAAFVGDFDLAAEVFGFALGGDRGVEAGNFFGEVQHLQGGVVAEFFVALFNALGELE